jgi:hypothetical protein
VSEQRYVVAVATYASKIAAVEDLGAMSDIGRTWQQCDIGLVEKGRDGRLRVDRYQSTHQQRERLAGALIVVAAPLAVRFLEELSASRANWSAIGHVADRIWYEIPQHQLRTMSALVELGQASLVVIAAEPAARLLDASLARAKVAVVTDGVWLDLQSHPS